MKKNRLRKVSLGVLLFTIAAFIVLTLLFDIDINSVLHMTQMFCFEKDVEVDKEEVEFIAIELFEEMKASDSGMLKEYELDSITESYLVYQYLDKNVLLGSCTKPVIKRGMKGYIIGWINGENIIKQHEIAEQFIDDIITEFDIEENSEEKLLEKIADKVCNNYIKEYDYTYSNRSVYDLYNSIDSSGVCTVYSSLFKNILNKYAIESTVIIGKTTNNSYHVWNEVIFRNGSIHYYDLTAYAETKDKRFLDISKKNYKNLYCESSNYEVATKVNLNFGG